MTARRLRLAAARGLVVAVLALAVSVGLVFKSAPPASAFVIPPVPIAVGAAGMASSPGTGAVVGGVCATGVGCLALGAVLVGGMLYATKDSWMPWLKSKVNFGHEKGQRADGSSGCPITFRQIMPDLGGAIAVTFDYDASCGGGPQAVGPEMKLQILNRTCMGLGVSGKPAGTTYVPGSNVAAIIGTYQNMSTGAGATAGTNITLGGTDPTCANGGGALYSAVIQITAQRGLSRFVDVIFPLPEIGWKQTSTVTCKRPDGSTFNLTDSEVGHPERLAAPSCIKVDPTSWPINITTTGPGGAETIFSWSDDPAPQYPNCYAATGLVCKIKVHVDGLPCVVGMNGCVHWWRNANDERMVDWKDRIDCRFGEYVVPIAICEPLKRAYVPDAPAEPEPITEPIPLPPPDPLDYPADEPWPDGDPNPSPNPTPTPGAPLPTAGPNPVPTPTNPDGPADSHSCLGSGWSWNPVSWVYVPVKCALVWAFVPKNPPSFGDVPSPLPAGWLPTFPGLTDGACGVVNMPSLNLGSLLPSTGAKPLFDTCDAPWPTVRSFTYYGTLALVLVGIGHRALRAGMTALGMGVDTPAGGGDD